MGKRECRKCSAIIPTWTTIDGKRKSLQNRKFCLECSPYGAHNTKPVLDVSDLTLEARQARRRAQLVRATQRRREKVMKMAVDYKGGACLLCGYNKCSRALEFHHVNPEEKLFSISRDGNTRSWEKVKAELDKCVLLCANCHREVEAGITFID